MGTRNRACNVPSIHTLSTFKDYEKGHTHVRKPRRANYVRALLILLMVMCIGACSAAKSARHYEPLILSAHRSSSHLHAKPRTRVPQRHCLVTRTCAKIVRVRLPAYRIHGVHVPPECLAAPLAHNVPQSRSVVPAALGAWMKRGGGVLVQCSPLFVDYSDGYERKEEEGARIFVCRMRSDCSTSADYAHWLGLTGLMDIVVTDGQNSSHRRDRGDLRTGNSRENTHIEHDARKSPEWWNDTPHTAWV